MVARGDEMNPLNYKVTWNMVEKTNIGSLSQEMQHVPLQEDLLMDVERILEQRMLSFYWRKWPRWYLSAGRAVPCVLHLF